MDLWENHQIWPDSSSRHWWRTCSLPRAPMFSDSPWHREPPSPLWHLQGLTPSREQDQHLRSLPATTCSYQSTPLFLQPSLQLTSLPAQRRMAEVHSKQKGLNHSLLVSPRGQWWHFHTLKVTLTVAPYLWSSPSDGVLLSGCWP